MRVMFRARRGASAELARRLDISASAVARWLAGDVVSARIERAALRMARRWARAAAKAKRRAAA